MKLLAFDTALNACSVAIVDVRPTDDSRVLARVTAAGGKGNAERLLPLIERARREAGIDLAALDGIAATIGPGSFTGIRTALATARGLGLALGKPVYGVTTTQALAAAAAQPGSGTVAAIDARRDEVYLQVFDANGGADTDPLLLPLARAVAILPAVPLTLVGSGAVLLQQAAGRTDLRLSQADPDPDPVLVARLAAAMPVPQRPPAPLYIRPPDAALPKAAPPPVRLAVAIQPAGPETVPVLAALHAAAFAHEPWSAASLADLLAMPGAAATLAMTGDRPVGFLLLRRAADEAEVVTLAVPPPLQRQGIARALLAQGLATLQAQGVVRCFLEVASDNRPARSLYLAAGFAEVGRRAAYYKTPAGPRDAIVMERRLGSAAPRQAGSK